MAENRGNWRKRRPGRPWNLFFSLLQLLFILTKGNGARTQSTPEAIPRLSSLSFKVRDTQFRKFKKKQYFSGEGGGGDRNKSSSLLLLLALIIDVIVYIDFVKRRSQRRENARQHVCSWDRKRRRSMKHPFDKTQPIKRRLSQTEQFTWQMRRNFVGWITPFALCKKTARKIIEQRGGNLYISSQQQPTAR